MEAVGRTEVREGSGELFRQDDEPLSIAEHYAPQNHITLYHGDCLDFLAGLPEGSNPKGKNPGDLWVIPNVKHNHVEKTDHPCQFPVELIERLILSMTGHGGMVLDPFMGVGSSAVAAVQNERRWERKSSSRITPRRCSV